MSFSNQNMSTFALKQSVCDTVSYQSIRFPYIRPNRWLAETFPAVLLYYTDSSAAQRTTRQVQPVRLHLHATLYREVMRCDRAGKH